MIASSAKIRPRMMRSRSFVPKVARRKALRKALVDAQVVNGDVTVEKESYERALQEARSQVQASEEMVAKAKEKAVREVAVVKKEAEAEVNSLREEIKTVGKALEDASTAKQLEKSATEEHATTVAELENKLKLKVNCPSF